MEYQEEYRMADLIRRQWLGIITAEEQAELEAWSLQEEHARLYAKIRNQAELQKRNLYVDGLDVDGVWHKLREQIADVPVRKRRFFTRYRVVACLLLLIGVGTLLVYNRYSRLQPSDLLVQSIHPGSSKAVLITNEGKQIILQDSLNQEIQVDESVTVKNTGLLNIVCRFTGQNRPIILRSLPRGGNIGSSATGWLCVMNADSEIRFPVVFTQTRQVSLKGEAYFKVEKDSLHPFIVNVYDKLKVEVLGTEFNVQAYSGDEVVKTTLNCGKVRVMMGKEALELVPDQQAVCDLRHRRFHKIEVNANYFSAWKDGKFIFEDEPLENILNSLARWYNISVFYQNEELKNFHFTGDLERYDDFSVALRMLEKATNIRFLVTGRTVVVQII
ncbi:MAG: FecR family protein [Odoribacter splanchnicus]